MINKALNHKLYKKHRELVLYGLIGISGATLDYVSFVFLYSVLGVNPLLATTVSISLGITNNFFLNRHYNFKMKDKTLKRFLSFYSVGIFGIILSILIIFVLHDIFSMNANIAKLISIPPIVLTQYILNKNISFGMSLDNIGKVLRKYSFLIIINAIYLLSVALFMKYTTITLLSTSVNQPGSQVVTLQPPDEVGHYTYNVKYLLENKKLPVSGRDDLAALKTCRNNTFGQVPCVYSYQIYPAVPYIISAISSGISGMVGLNHEMGARLPGLLYALIFLNSVYFAVLAITKRTKVAALLAIGVSFIPQVMFTFAYLNLDGFSMAVSALLGLTLVNFIMNPRLRNAALLGICAGGLLSVSKYNYFVLLIPTIALLAYSLKADIISKKQLLFVGLSSVLAFTAIGMFWYVRNYILYSDFLGQTFVLNEMAKYHPLGVSRLSAHGFVYLTAVDFWGILFRSTIASFGSMAYYLDSGAYNVIGFTLFGLAIYVTYRTFSTKNKRLLFGWSLLFATIILTIGQVVYNSLAYDFQPQGRYLFPILIPIALYLAYHWTQDKEKSYLTPLALFAITAFMYIVGLDLFIRTYL